VVSNSRQVPSSTACIHCSVEESVEHALLFYPFARAVWDGVKEHIGIQLNRRSFNSPKLWLFDFPARCTKEEANTLAVMFWHVWDTRNKLREEGGVVNPLGVARRVIAYVDTIQVHMYQSCTSPRRNGDQVRSLLCEKGRL
jgi:hypothetical protein